MRVRILFITLLAIGFAGSAYLNVQQHTTAVKDNKALRDQLAVLKSRAAAQASNSPAPGDSPAPDTLTTEQLGQSLVGISIFDVKLTVTDPITDLVYGEVKNYGSASAGFTTESLLAKYPMCKAGALGALVRVKSPNSPTPSPTRSAAPTRTPSYNQPFKKWVAGYTYSYQSPYFTCADDQPGRNLVAQAVAALKNQLPTLTAK
jgi:hypothetical protein